MNYDDERTNKVFYVFLMTILTAFILGIIIGAGLVFYISKN